MNNMRLKLLNNFGSLTIYLIQNVFKFLKGECNG